MHPKTIILYDRQTAADYIGSTYKTLAYWHSRRKRDLKPVTINGIVYYQKDILDEYRKEKMKALLPF